MGRENKRKVTMSLDPRSVVLMDQYAKELHLSRSAFVDLMVTQIDQVLRVTGLSEKESSGPAVSNSNAGTSGIPDSGHD